MTTLLPPLDPAAVDKALADFAAAVRAAYGERVEGVYLFGSRARGDHGPDSDADVAVVLDDLPGRAWDAKRELIDLAYDHTLASGIHLSPWPFRRAEWETGGTPLAMTARRDAKPVGSAR